MSNVWYVANTLPHKEFLAAEQLRNQGFEVFLPATRRQVRHARQVTEKLNALFPSYLFVAEDENRWRSINGTRGVRRLIMAGEEPARVLPGLVEELKASVDEHGVFSYQGPLATGDRVRIESGPFADLAGSIAALGPDDRVAVLLDLMASQTPVDLDRKRVMPLGSR